MLSMLLAYNAAGEIIATLDHMVARDEAGSVVGLVDFTAHEETGGKLRDVWDVQGAAGSGTWPEWIGGKAHDFTVELDDKRIVALVHKDSGHRRKRAVIETEIAKRIARANGEPADLRDLLGGPDRALALDERGRNAKPAKVQRAALPIIRADRPR